MIAVVTATLACGGNRDANHAPTLALLTAINHEFVHDVGATIGDFIVPTWGREAGER